MKIYINDQIVEIFSGATVRDAVALHLNRDEGRQTIQVEDILDHRGNSLSPAGELSEDDRIYIKKCDE